MYLSNALSDETFVHSFQQMTSSGTTARRNAPMNRQVVCKMCGAGLKTNENVDICWMCKPPTNREMTSVGGRGNMYVELISMLE